MKLAIFGRNSDRTNLKVLVDFFAFLKERGIGYLVHDSYAKDLSETYDQYDKEIAPYIFSDPELLSSCDFAYSFGGDGTFLDTSRVVRDRLPLLGINFGRLGFLTSILGEELLSATDELSRDMYRQHFSLHRAQH